MKPLDITGCIVVYNNDLQEVVTAANSFLDTALNVELTIIDNCSKTNILRDLKNVLTDNRIKFILNDKNGGYGYGHNRGLHSSNHSNYHLILNPDTIVHKNSLETMVQFMDKNRDIGLLSPRVLNPDGSLQKLNKINPYLFILFARRFLPKFIHKIQFIQNEFKRYSMENEGYENTIDVPFLSGCCLFFRKSLIEKMDYFFDDKLFLYFEDADITRRISKFSRTVYFPGASITHSWNRQAHHSLKYTFIFIKSAIYYFNKWGWKFL